MAPAIGLSEFTRAALRTLCTRTCTSIEVHKGGIHMMTKKINVTTTVLLSLLTVVLFQISVKTSAVRAAEEQDKSGSQTQRPHGDDANLPNGVIGVSLRVGAERIGDPASLYVAHVHPEGPAQQAGVKHGEEVVTVNGAALTGKTYEQVMKMVRGEAGTAVKLGVKGDGGVREIAITRIASEKLFKGEMGSHGKPAR
jgi:predicted metalloprotease with PDZ domain